VVEKSGLIADLESANPGLKKAGIKKYEFQELYIELF
jgi:hypothetical protein